jgi:PIN domain nuclease of toxin-antitoxin system
VIVLDASALVALWKKEPGWERVSLEIPVSAVSAANLAEALSKLTEDGGNPEVMADDFAKSGCKIVPVSAEQAVACAKLRLVTRRFGLSLGDRLCLALAIERNCPVLTADRNWNKLSLGIPVQLIR